MVASTPSPVFAEPLWVPNISTTSCGTANLVIVATVDDDVLAYNADNVTCSGTGSNLVWTRA